MIKLDKIKVNISYRNITHYLKLGYNPILNSELEINTNHLSKSSHVKIDVICSICNVENNLMYDKYIKNVERQGFYGCRKCSRQKAAMTSLDKYGVDNYSKTDEWKKRVESTNIKKFGYKTNLISPKYKTNIENILINKYGTKDWWNIKNVKTKLKVISKDKIKMTKIIYSEDLYDNAIINSSYLLYRNECRRITESNIKTLMIDWDGLDYYTKDDISSNFNLDHNNPNYPTIDHKNSVYFGFINNIKSSEIGSLENLCITKRTINSSKRHICEIEFLNSIKSELILI
jgi:hypothetical protein